MLKNICLLLAISFSANWIFSQNPIPAYYVSSYRPAQGGSEAGATIDGDDGSIYHSDWDINAIPDTLTFYFSPLVPSVNRMEYTPRQSGLNGVWTRVDILYSTQTNPTHFERLFIKPEDWELNNEKKTIDLSFNLKDPYAIKFAVLAAEGNFSSCAEMRFWGAEPLRPDGSEDCIIDAGDIHITDDLKISISAGGSLASSYQPWENIEKSFDGDHTTLYHSNYDQGEAAFPIDLIYHFEGKPAMDYFIYYPRNDGGSNGFFGQASVYYNTEDGGTYTHLTDYDFGMEGLPVRVYFPSTIQAYNIKIVVYNGAGGFASCAEIEFYKKTSIGPGGFEYAAIFENDLYSGVRNNVTQNMIDTISSPFFRSLAQCIFNGSYNHSIRVRSYTAFESLARLSSRLKTSRYDAYENATGLVFEEGQKAVLFVKGMGAEPVYLRIRDFADEEDPADHVYQLVEGKNVLTMQGSGLAYISYYSEMPQHSAPVTINITNGKINGYFDPREHTSRDWLNLMSNSAYPKFDIVGEYTHLVYDKAALRQNSPFDGSHLIRLYDTIVNWQKIQAGIYKYGHDYPNRMLAVSGTGGGWYAGGLGVHLDLTWGPESVTDANRLDLWGIPHEFGHINQIRPGLRWIGMTEVTNNIHSLWAYYKLNKVNKKYTRLESEEFTNGSGTQERAGNRFNAFIDATHIGRNALQDFDEDYHFRVLIPFWQLQLYYQVAGACRDAPELTYEEDPDVPGVDYAHWYGIVAEKVRNTDVSGMSNGELLLSFVRNTCDAVQEDLTGFFANTGFLQPIDKDIDDYGIGRLTVTQAQIDATTTAIKAQYPNKPVSPVISYISAHSVDMFKYRRFLDGSTGDGVELVEDDGAPYLLVDHNIWKNAVAYEAYDSTDRMIHVTITGTGDLTNKTTYVQYPEGAYKVYAIGYNGQKILVYPKETVSTKRSNGNTGLKIFPNPVMSGNTIRLEPVDIRDPYRLEIYDPAGRLIYTDNNNIKEINNGLMRSWANRPAGSYFVRLNSKQSSYLTSFIVL